MAKAVPIIIPKWVTDLKIQHPTNQPSAYKLLPTLTQWLHLRHMQLELEQLAANSGVMFHVKHLFQAAQEAAIQAGNTHPLVARISSSAFIAKQLCLTIASDEKRPQTFGSYVLRTTNAGMVEGVRIAAEFDH